MYIEIDCRTQRKGCKVSFLTIFNKNLRLKDVQEKF